MPGDDRGFVGNVRESDWTQVTHNTPGATYDSDIPALTRWVGDNMNGPPVTLELRQAEVLIKQYQETASIRKWSLEAASVMCNHTHLVVGVHGDREPDSIRKAFVSWATRAL